MDQTATEKKLTGNELISDVLLDVEDVCRLTFSGEELMISRVTGRQINQVRQRVARLLSPIIPGEDRPRPQYTLEGADLNDVEFGEIKDFVEIGNEGQLRYNQHQIKNFIRAAVDRPEYQQAVKAYQNQEKQPALRQELYSFLLKNGFREAPVINSDQLLFHGINLGEPGNEIKTAQLARQKINNPADYLYKINCVQEQGIIADKSAETLPQIESVSCAEDINYVKGVAAVGFRLNPDEKVWRRIQGLKSGRHLVQPALKRPDFNPLVLRSERFYDVLDTLEVRDIFGLVSHTKYRQFISKLIALLHAKKLTFQMIDPDGKTREPQPEEF